MVDARTVIAPQDMWETKEILILGDDKIGSDALAFGLWDGKPRLASRWNSTSVGGDSNKGNPTSSGHPTWYVLPEWMEIGVLAAANLTPELRIKALKLLNKL